MAISPQLPQFSKEVVEKNNLTFPVLADIDNKVASLFGLTFTLPEDLQEIYGNFGIDLKKFNSSSSGQLPMSGRFIIDAKGVVQNVDVHPDYTKRPDPTEIVALLSNI